MSDTNDSFRGDQVLRASLASLASAIVFVGLRLFSRWRLLHKLNTDDWVLLAALLFSICHSISISFEIKGGLGKHMWALSHSEINLFLKSLWINIIFYTVSLILTKVSILIGYLYVFPNPRVHLATKFMMGILAVFSMFYIISTCFLCTPIDRFWDRSKPGTCVNSEALWLSHAGMNMFTDLIIIIIPLPVLSSLCLPRKTKLWLVLVFGLGFFVTIVSIVRIPMMVSMFKSPDVSYLGPGLAILSALENNVAIFCASLPPLRSLLKHYFPSLVGTTNSSENPPLRISPHKSGLVGRLYGIITRSEVKEEFSTEVV